MTSSRGPEITTNTNGEPIYDGDTQALIDAVRQSNAPADLDPNKPQHIIVPPGALAVIPDLKAWRAAPYRRTGTYRPATVEALAAYAEWQQVEEQTTIWVHPTSGRVVAIFDDNGADPGWGEHRAQLDLSPTPEWQHWAGQDGRLMPQEDFALHIEAGLQEIEQPDAADMLEMAQSFRVSNNASFRSSKRLASGERQFLYDEAVEAKAGRSGEITVPEVFVLMLSPFIGEAERQVVAKLRYRMAAGAFSIGYKLERPEKVVQDALDGVAEALVAKFPRVFSGEPA